MWRRANHRLSRSLTCGIRRCTSQLAPGGVSIWTLASFGREPRMWRSQVYLSVSVCLACACMHSGGCQMRVWAPAKFVFVALGLAMTPPTPEESGGNAPFRQASRTLTAATLPIVVSCLRQQPRLQVRTSRLPAGEVVICASGHGRPFTTCRTAI